MGPAISHVSKEMWPPSSLYPKEWTIGPWANLKHVPIDMPIPQRPLSLPILRRTLPSWTGTWWSGPAGGSGGR